MKRRVRFIKIPKGTRVQGVFGGATEYVREGDEVGGNQGGGFIGPMELVGGTLHIKKVDAEGKPYRNFGQVSGRGTGATSNGADTRNIPLLVDAVSVSAAGFTVLYDEEADAAPTVQDPPSAKPVQQSGQNQPRRQ